MGAGCSAATMHSPMDMRKQPRRDFLVVPGVLFSDTRTVLAPDEENSSDSTQNDTVSRLQISCMAQFHSLYSVWSSQLNSGRNEPSGPCSLIEYPEPNPHQPITASYNSGVIPMIISEENGVKRVKILLKSGNPIIAESLGFHMRQNPPAVGVR